MRTASWLLFAATAFAAVPQTLWDRKPGHDFYVDYYLIGNGYMGISTNNNPIQDEMDLTLDTLWSGGPFNATEDNPYNGGNPTTPFDPAILQGIRSEIFDRGNSSVIALQQSSANYGSLTTAGWFYALGVTLLIPIIKDGSVSIKAIQGRHGCQRGFSIIGVLSVHTLTKFVYTSYGHLGKHQ